MSAAVTIDKELGTRLPERELAERVLREPGGGAGSYFPATASGQPLALAGFGIALGMLSTINAHWVAPAAVGLIVPVAASIGAIALILAGMWDYRGNNTFGGMWAVAFGCFWASVALIVGVSAGGVVKSAGAAGFGDAFGAYLLIWALFTAFMTVGAYYVARPAFVTFALLVVVLVVLGLSNLAAPGSGGATDLGKLGGYLGLVDAALAFYLSAALVINATAGRTVLPIKAYPYR